MGMETWSMCGLQGPGVLAELWRRLGGGYKVLWREEDWAFSYFYWGSSRAWQRTLRAAC